MLMSLDDFIIPTITELDPEITNAFGKVEILDAVKYSEIEAALALDLSIKNPTFSAVEEYAKQIIQCYIQGYSLTSAQNALLCILRDRKPDIEIFVKSSNQHVKTFQPAFEQACLQIAVMDTYRERPHFVFIEALRDATCFGEENLFRKITREERDEIIACRSLIFSKKMPDIDGLRYIATRLEGDPEFKKSLITTIFVRDFDEFEAMLEMRSEFTPKDFLSVSALYNTLNTMGNIYCNYSKTTKGKMKNFKEDDDDFAVY